MFKITSTDNPVVFAYYTHVKYYGLDIKDVPEQWGIQEMVRKRIEEESN